jgi:6-phosphogluconolactonase (cycloisomerase 2 family)
VGRGHQELSGGAQSQPKLDRVSGGLNRLGKAIASGGATGMAVDPRGRFVFANDKHMSMLRLDAESGALSQVDQVSAAGGIAVTSNGRYVLLADFSGGISVFRLDAENGKLTNVERVSVASGSGLIAVTPDRRFVVVVNSLAEFVSVFRLDAESG